MFWPLTWGEIVLYRPGMQTILSVGTSYLQRGTPTGRETAPATTLTSDEQVGP